MSFKFTTAQATLVENAVIELRSKSDNIQSHVERINKSLSEELEALNELVAGYNTALGQVREVVIGVHDDAEAEFDDKSERWQDSEKGCEIRNWIDELENIELDDIDLYEVAPLGEFDPEHPNWLEEMPTEPNE